ncbi:hypothetical protein AVEN_132862-1 [Araneus ventricosus]|uniref:Uncharacterized protein n=1 Tax=Araneus ventricosus TaxID=182803 RepID=A0A4Y2GV51_ARAVE|nr:hypothetical protein AVEN_132862-1 [Araneus ventricosus]
MPCKLAALAGYLPPKSPPYYSEWRGNTSRQLINSNSISAQPPTDKHVALRPIRKAGHEASELQAEGCEDATDGRRRGWGDGGRRDARGGR